MEKTSKQNKEELYLELQEGKIANSEEVAVLSQEKKSHSFIIQYVPGEKEALVLELEKFGCSNAKVLDFMNCIVVSLNATQLKAAKALDCVSMVERDYDYKCLSYGINRKELVAYLAGENPNANSAKEVKLALFDTGVVHFPIDGSVNFINDGTEDENSHGTQMAGIVSSVIADAENRKAKPYVYSVVVVDRRGFAKTSSILEALNWAIQNKIKIISMSFGDYHKSALLEEMINRVSAHGIIMVAAVGNDGAFKDESRMMYPAAFANVLSVGAKNGKTVAAYSNSGIGADCFADGAQNTKDANGNQVTVIGTSGAAAFVAGTILNKWCLNPEKSAADIIACIKTEMAIATEEESTDSLTKTAETAILVKTDSSMVSVAEANALDETNDAISVFCIEDDDYDSSSSNDMASAIHLPFINWRSDSIDCPGDERWYKFTANADGVHPNGSPGWYLVHTQGELDTVGYLYDSNGNQLAYSDDDGANLNFYFWVQLDYYETYYIRVRAYGDNTGDFGVRVSYLADDHGNTFETATQVPAVYYEDKSVTGYLHSENDVDYYAFVPARNCVMEIYTEGDTDTYGQLYCESGSLLDADNDSNGNGNFKITAHLEGMKWYYIAVSHNSATGYGDYTLRFKFVKDYGNKTGVVSATWHNDMYDPLPYDLIAEDNIRCKIWLNQSAAYKWYYDVVENTTVQSKLSEFIQDFNESLIIDYLVSKLPFNANYIQKIGVSVLLGMLITACNPPDAKEQFVDAYMRIDPANSAVAYVCGTMATLVDYYPIILTPIDGSEYDIMGYEYDASEYFYGLPYYRGNFVYRYS